MTTPAPIPGRAWAAMIVGSATVVLVILDAGFVALAFPEIEKQFDETSRATLGWVFSGYFIALASFMLVAGWVADRIGRRRVFFAGLGIFAVGAVLTGLSTSPGMLIASRVVQGTGAAALTPVSLAMVLPEFPASRRATAVGAWAVAGASAGVVSPTLGSVLVEWAGWRAPFFSFVPIVTLAWLVGRRVLPEHVPGTRRPIDAAGVVLTTIVVAAAALAVSQGDDWGWTSPATIAAIVIPVIVGPLLVGRARHDPDAVLDVEVFSIRTYSTATVISVLSQAGFFAFFFSIPLLLIDVWGWSTLEAGMAIAFNQFISAVVGMPAGRRSDRAGHSGVIVTGGLIAAVGYGWLALGVGAEASVWSVVVPSFVLTGVGSMMVGGTVSAAAFRDVDDARLGRASAAYYVTRRLGSALGAIVAVAILGDRVGVDAVPAFRAIWLFSAGCFLGSAAVMGALFDTPIRGSRGGAPSAPAA